MKLIDLVQNDGPLAAAAGAIGIAGITADSRGVAPGFVFVAVPGVKADGARYVADACRAGAAAIVAETRPEGLAPDVAFVQVDNARLALARFAARFYPAQPATIAAVTGTSGKTSVAAFTRQIWAALGHKAASIGTVGLIAPDRAVYGSLTTPDPVSLHRMLDEIARAGVTHLAMEASSHGLDQHRLDGVRVAAAGFTNLSRDHLDYHPDVESYFRAKLRLFAELAQPGGAAVIAADHPESARVVDVARQRGLNLFTVGRAGEAIRLAALSTDGFAQILTLHHDGREYSVRLPLAGAFQVENALVAAGFALATNGSPDHVFAALENLKGAPGRLEQAGSRHGAPVFIDYAHKPDALANALDALRAYATGRLIVVFGAGGDRDRGKRPLMGAIARDKADVVIVTDDNPRSEDPATIRAAIRAAVPEALEIADRGEAIARAVGMLRAGDVLLVAGKGHETGQIVGDRTLHFSDHEAVAAALGAKTA